jgi:hypothetical protein
MVSPRRWLVLLLLGLAPALAGQRGPHYFYTGVQYGSQATYHPLIGILHSGFYNFQVDNRGDDPFDVAFGRGVGNVLRNLAHPVATVRAYGLGNLLTSEVVPNADPARGQWVPNYFGHVFGEGLVFRMAYEWYDANGVPHPRAMALMTTLTGALVNEAVENGTYTGPNADPVVDMYLFNPIGIALFSSDGFARFAARNLGIAYWPLQAAVDPSDRTLQNVGYRTAFNVPVAANGRLALFFTYGIQGLAGVSWRFPNSYHLALGAGAAASSLVDAQAEGEPRRVTATTGPAFGLFFDRKRSLLASLVVTPEKQDRVTLNLYPGWLGRGGWRPGVAVAWDVRYGMRWSLQVGGLPLGIAWPATQPPDFPPGAAR